MAKEQEKKIEERKKNLIGEWDDEEDGEICLIYRDSPVSVVSISAVFSIVRFTNSTK